MMSPRCRSAATVSLLVVLGSGLAPWLARSPAQDPGSATTRRFSPGDHFPGPALLYAVLSNVARLDENLAATLPGRILADRGTQRAFAGFLGWIQDLLRQGSGPFVELTGRSPLEVLGLFRGEVAFSLRRLSTAGVPEAVLALELGKDREAITDVAARLRQAVRGQGGGDGDQEETATFEGIEAKLWPTPAGQLFECILGTHLVLATSESAWQATVTSYLGGGGTSPARKPIVPEAVVQRLGVEDREALLYIDLAGLREIALALAGDSTAAADLRRVLEVSGASGLTAAAVALGFRDGGPVGALHLGLRAGEGGILEAIRSGLPPLGKDAGEALALVPARALELQAVSIAPGKLLRGIDAVLRSGVPHLAEGMDELYRMVEGNLGISVEQDLFTLGAISLVAFTIQPPAGGVCADHVALVRTEAVAAYWKVLEAAAAALDAPIEPIEAVGGKVLTCNLGSGKAAAALRRSILDGFEPSPTIIRRLVLLTIGSGINVARADLPGGWTALSSLPQAVVRHVESYATGPGLAADGELAALLKAQLPGATGLEIHQGDRTFLHAYNSAVSLLGALAPLCAVAGVQPAHLPPAERFLADVRAGFLRLEVGPEGFTLRSHRGLGTSTTVLAAVGAGAMLAGFLVPAITRGRAEAYAVQCANNLKQLYGLALVYADQAGDLALPYSKDGSIAGLQLLIEQAGMGAVPADLFNCPESDHAAPHVEDGKVALTEESCSYELVPGGSRSPPWTRCGCSTGGRTTAVAGTSCSATARSVSSRRASFRNGSRARRSAPRSRRRRRRSQHQPRRRIRRRGRKRT